MSRQSSRHSSLFLLELIAAIFFFCLASAVCIRFFVKSHTLSQDAHNLDMAVNQSSLYAELFRNEDDFVKLADEQCPDGTFSGSLSTYTLYYDRKWNLCSKKNAMFSLVISIEDNKSSSLASFTVSKQDTDEEIYSLDVEKYTGGGMNDEGK